jgi:hypothetical protein
MFSGEFYNQYSFSNDNHYLVDGDTMNQLLIVIMGLIEERPEINEKFLLPLVKRLVESEETKSSTNLNEMLDRCGLTLHNGQNNER